MRTSFAVAAGLVAVAYAGTTTITDTVDVTITSCEPTVTNCPYKGGAGDADHTWSDWVSASTTTTKPVKPATTTSVYDPTWSDWESTTTTTKPVSPATTSSYDPSWSDWESTTSSKPVSPVTTSTYDPTWSDWEGSTWATSATPVKPASTTSTWTPVAAASTGIASYTGAPVSPATYTGAANVNAGSFALAGLAAAAALVIA